MVRVPALPLLLSLAACSGSNFRDGTPLSAEDSGRNTLTGTTSDTGPTSPTAQPAFFAVSGSLQLAADEIDPALSTIEIDYRNAESASLCSGIRTVLTATIAPIPDPSAPIFGWWTIELDLSPCGIVGPDTLELGIGAWDGGLNPPAAAQNLDGANLYAIYGLDDPTGDAVAFGATGTSEQFTGVTPPVTSAPLPDGSYQLRTLYLRPFQGP